MLVNFPSDNIVATMSTSLESSIDFMAVVNSSQSNEDIRWTIQQLTGMDLVAVPISRRFLVHIWPQVETWQSSDRLPKYASVHPDHC